MQRSVLHRDGGAPCSSAMQCVLRGASLVSSEGWALQRGDTMTPMHSFTCGGGRGALSVQPVLRQGFHARCLQTLKLKRDSFLSTQRCLMHKISSPAAFVESAPQSPSSGDGLFSDQRTSTTATTEVTAPKRSAFRHRRAKRAAASTETTVATAEHVADKAADVRDMYPRPGRRGDSRHSHPSPYSTASLQRSPQQPRREEEGVLSRDLDLIQAARLPAPPTRENATPESICSYLLTLRRAVAMNRTGTSRVSLTRRAAAVFMRQILPSLMTMPPIPKADMLIGAPSTAVAAAAASPTNTPDDNTVDTMHDAKLRGDNPGSDYAYKGCGVAAFTHPSFPPRPPPRGSHHKKSEVSSMTQEVPLRCHGWGKGSVSWTEALAEAVLLLCNKIDIDIRYLWAARAALLYLVAEEENGYTHSLQQRLASSPSSFSGLTRTPASALKDKAQLALALMRTLENSRRQSRLMREVLRPVSLRLSLKARERRSGMTPSDGSGLSGGGGDGGYFSISTARTVQSSRDTCSGDVVGESGRMSTDTPSSQHAAPVSVPPQEGSFVNIERYLAQGLLPLLYGEFIHFCRAVEQGHDRHWCATSPIAAEAAATAPDTATAAASASQRSQQVQGLGEAARRPCVLTISRSDMETFSLLAAVLHRAIGLHSVVRSGDDIHFDLENNVDAYVAATSGSSMNTSDLGSGAETSAELSQRKHEPLKGVQTTTAPVSTRLRPRRPPSQPAVPLRAFRLTIDAIATQLDAMGGPRTGAQELVWSQSLSRSVREAFAVQIDLPPPFVPPHAAAAAGDLCAGGESGGGGGSGGQLPDASPSSISRFGGVAACSARTSRACASDQGKAYEDAPGVLMAGGESPHQGKGLESTPSLAIRFGNFNVDVFLPILNFCLHDRSFHLFLTTSHSSDAPAATRCNPGGNPVSASSTTLTGHRPSVETDVGALAAAVSNLLLLSVYWAPLCRTYQLPVVLSLFVRATTVEPAHTVAERPASSAPRVASPAAPHSAPAAILSGAEEAAGVAPLVPLDAELVRQIQKILLPLSDDLTSSSSPYVQQLRRLLFSSGRYLERTNFGLFSSITISLDRVLSQWPLRPPTAEPTASVHTLGMGTTAGGGCASINARGGGEYSSPSVTMLPWNAAGMSSAAASAGDLSVALRPSEREPTAAFRAPPAAAMATLHLFAAVLDEFWARMRGRTIWQSISRRGRSHYTNASNVSGVGGGQAIFIGYGPHTSTHSQLRVTVPNVAIGVGDAASPATVRATLLAPSYVLRQMGLRVAAAERTGTPDEFLKVYQTSERVESFMAVPNIVGAATAARPLIDEYLKGDFMWGAVPNSALVPLITALVELEITSMTVPEFLMRTGSLEGIADRKGGPLSSSRLQGRFTECLQPKTIMGLKARIEPHELRLLTADGADVRALYESGGQDLPGMLAKDASHPEGTTSLLNLTLRRVGKDGCVLDSAPSSSGGMPSAACQHAGGGGDTASSPASRLSSSRRIGENLTTTRFPSPPVCYSVESATVMLWEPAYSRSCDEKARIPRKALVPLLRSVTLLAEAERRLNDVAPPDSSTSHREGDSISLRGVDFILRVAYRLLFDPTDGTPAMRTPGAGVPLEALVTLYMGLTSLCKDRLTSSSMKASGVHTASQQPCKGFPSSTRKDPREGSVGDSSTVPLFVLLGVDCCLAHCEAALRAQLMGIACDTLKGDAVDSASAISYQVTSDFRVLLQLAVLAEELLPCRLTGGPPTTAGASVSTSELLHRQLFRELEASLRVATLQQIAGEVSKLLWWVTRRASTEAMGDGASNSQSVTSWVETLLLREIEEKRLPVAGRDPTSTSRLSVGRTSFQLFEWTLLPFYTKLDTVPHDLEVATCVEDTTAATPVSPLSAPMLDDFTSLEDDHIDFATGLSPPTWCRQSTSHELTNSAQSKTTVHKSTAGSDAGAPPLSAKYQSAVRHTATLEVALHALPAQCDSFHVFLHVVRQLFLSHPILLSTAPDAALYYELRTVGSGAAERGRHTFSDPSASTGSRMEMAAVGRRAWAALPAQRTDLSQDLRQRYVDALFRLFKRLVYHQSCTAEELVELLHLLWLADPHASSIATSTPSSTAAPTSQWPSLYVRCSAFVKESLAELDAAAAAASTSVQDGCAGFADDSNAIPSSSLRQNAPDVIQTVYRVVHYGLSKSIAFKSREMHWFSVNAAALHPRSVVLFLQCLNTARRLQESHRQRVSSSTLSSVSRSQQQQRRHRDPRAHHTLSRTHKSALELFTPFVVYASITGEAICGVEKIRYIPLVLEALSEMDPQMVLIVIQAVFSGSVWSGDTVKGQGSSARGNSRERGSPSSMLYYHKVLAGSRVGLGSIRLLENGHFHSTRTSFSGSAQERQQLVDTISATMSALLMVASHTQASSTVWDSTGGGGGGVDGTSSPRATDSTPQRAPSLSIGRAHHHALIFLRNSLLELISVARTHRPLQRVSEYTLLQVMQLAVVRESPRLLRLLEWMFLSLLVPSPQRVERGGSPAARSRPHRGGFEVATTGTVTVSALPTSTTDFSGCSSGSGSGKVYTMCGIVMNKDNIDKIRVPATREAFLLLRLLPLQSWRSLLQRDVAWPRYRGYVLHGISRRSQSTAGAAKGKRHTEKVSRDPVAERWNEIRGSLVSILLSLDLESVVCLAEEAMGPMASLVVTTELLRTIARRRAFLDNSPSTSEKALVGVKRAVHVVDETPSLTKDSHPVMAHGVPLGIAASCCTRDGALHPEVWTSYEVLRRYASRGSVLRDEAVQPWLKAACDVIDQLASTQHTDFVAVLEREAAWQRRVTEASTYRGAAREEVPLGTSHQTAVEMIKAARAAAQSAKRGATESTAPMFDLGEDGVPEVSIVDVGDSEDVSASLGVRPDVVGGRGEGIAVRGSGHRVGRREDREAAPTILGTTTTDAVDDNTEKLSSELDTLATRPFVLDWHPIVEFLCVLRQVDPAISLRQVRLECWMRQPELATDAPLTARLLPAAHTNHFPSPGTPPGPLLPIAETSIPDQIDDARDVLHNAAGAILQHVREYWRAADRSQGMRPLLTMNMRETLRVFSVDTLEGRCVGAGLLERHPTASSVLYGGLAEAEGAAVVPSSEIDFGDSFDGVEAVRWLEGGAGSSVLVGGNRDPSVSCSASTSTLVLGLVRPCPILSVPSMRAVSATGGDTTVGEFNRRRLALLRRAGVLASPREMEQRCCAYRLSGAMPRDLMGVRQDTGEATFWYRKAQRLQREILECIFCDEDNTASAPTCSHALSHDVPLDASAVSGGGVSGEATVSSTAPCSMEKLMSDVERRARHRLQLLSCDDLAQLLLLLIASTTSVAHSPPPNAKGEAGEDGLRVPPSIRQLQIRIVLETMDDVLPSASTRELIQVVLGLLKLSISPTASIGLSGTDAATPQLLHYVRLEVRRLLANVAVLVANDVERFRLGELLWIITRLHTPFIRAAPAVGSPSETESLQQSGSEAATIRESIPKERSRRVSEDAPLDVSVSYMSAAVARAIRVAIEGTNSPSNSDPVDGIDAYDYDDDMFSVCTDKTTALNDPVAVQAESAPAVTVGQWSNAVAAAERVPSKSHIILLLRLVEQSAV